MPKGEVGASEINSLVKKILDGKVKILKQCETLTNSLSALSLGSLGELGFGIRAGGEGEDVGGRSKL